jgi:hypothetical protein
VSRGQRYAWRSAHRTSRQLGLLVGLVGIGLALLVVSLLVFGSGE